MKIDWQIIWEEFDEWWDRNEIDFKDDSQARFVHQSRKIQHLVNLQLGEQRPSLHMWEAIWLTVTEWWQVQKHKFCDWSVQKRKIQQVINANIGANNES